MSYKEAVEANGVKVLAEEWTGSYQGEWYMLTDNAELPIIVGAYGSCSVCDAFDAEFGWNDDKKEDYEERLKAFGKDCIDNSSLTWEEFEALVERNKNDRWGGGDELPAVLKKFKEIIDNGV